MLRAYFPLRARIRTSFFTHHTSLACALRAFGIMNTVYTFILHFFTRLTFTFRCSTHIWIIFSHSLLFSRFFSCGSLTAPFGFLFVHRTPAHAPLLRTSPHSIFSTRFGSFCVFCTSLVCVCIHVYTAFCVFLHVRCLTLLHVYHTAPLWFFYCILFTRPAPLPYFPLFFFWTHFIQFGFSFRFAFLHFRLRLV